MGHLELGKASGSWLLLPGLNIDIPVFILVPLGDLLLSLPSLFNLSLW